MTENPQIDHIVHLATTALDDAKAQDIVTLTTSDQTALFSRLIVASGQTARQVRALGGYVVEAWKEAHIEIIGTEGMDHGEWVLIDGGDVVVHVMTPAMRDYYDIETLWRKHIEP